MYLYSSSNIWCLDSVTNISISPCRGYRIHIFQEIMLSVLAPLEMLKFQPFLCNKLQKLHRVIKRVVGSQDSKVLWTGYPFNILLAAPFEAVKLCAYDIHKKQLTQSIRHEEITSSERFSASAAAGNDATMTCVPMDSGGDENGSRNKVNFLFRTSNGSPNRRHWTNVILALNVMVFAAQIASKGKLMLWGAKVNSLIDRGQIWRLGTSALLHANIGHLMVNCFSFNSVGPVVEAFSGPKRFLAVYAASALASSATSYIFCKSPAVGASGAIFGLTGSFAVFVLRHRFLIKDGKDDLLHIARVISLNMVIGIMSKGIDNWGHLGGLLGGAAVSWLVGPAWTYQYTRHDGRQVYVDKAPLHHFFKNQKNR